MDNKNITRIAVDAMGGDNAPDDIIRGAAKISRETDIHIALVGKEDIINDRLSDIEYNSKQCEIVNAEQVLTHEDSPKAVIRRKDKSSLTKCTKLCGAQEVDGMVSAGNTGAYILAALKYIPQLKGVQKPVIASFFPTWNEEQNKKSYSLIIDAGANHHSNVEELVQNALMGTVYYEDVRDLPDPRVSLLNVGEEPYKGGEPQRSVYEILDNNDDVNFNGNIEGNEILKGKTEVIVTEGFVGNVVLKTIEGAANTAQTLAKHAASEKLLWKLGLLALSGGIKQVKTFTDYSEYGGSPILGFNEVIIKAHGRSNSKAIYNAIKVAAKTNRDNICKEIENEVSNFEKNFHKEE